MIAYYHLISQTFVPSTVLGINGEQDSHGRSMCVGKTITKCGTVKTK